MKSLSKQRKDKKANKHYINNNNNNRKIALDSQLNIHADTKRKITP